MYTEESVDQLFSIENLRQMMMRAYLNDDQKEALRISQVLDNHLVSVQKEKAALEN